MLAIPLSKISSHALLPLPPQPPPPPPYPKTAIFDFASLCVVVLLLICSASYVHAWSMKRMDDGTYTSYFMEGGKQNGHGRPKSGFLGLMYKFARIGERLSPYISICCVLGAIHLVLFK